MARGFTLLEMLVALAILAIAMSAGMAALRPDDQRRLHDEAERLALLLDQAREESELGGQPLAWVATESDYEFHRRELGSSGYLAEKGGEWNVARGDDLLRPRKLPAGMLIQRLQVDGVDQPLGQRVRLESGHTLRIDLVLGEARARVLGNLTGYRAEAVE